MAYYPIKCPFCLREHNNDTVVYDINEITYDKIETVTSRLPSDQAEGRRGGERLGNAGQPELPRQGFYTLPEIKKLCEDCNYELLQNEKEVHALSELTDEPLFGGPLVTALKIVKTESNRRIEMHMRNRYCDCDPNHPHKMESIAGSIPSYVFLLMGSSEAGKTVFLASLYHELAKTAFQIPNDTAIHGEEIAEVSMMLLNGDGSDAILPLSEISSNLFQKGEMPLGTLDIYNEPLKLEITSRIQYQGNMIAEKKALIYLRDMPGEWWGKPEKYAEIQQMMNLFPNFDAFLLILDPAAFSQTIFPLGIKGEESEKQLNRLRMAITNTIVAPSAGNKVMQDTAVVVTKGDYFFDPQYEDALHQNDISLEKNLIFDAKETYDQSYCAALDNSIGDGLIGKISLVTQQWIKNNFKNPFYSLVSALNKNPIILLKDGKIVESINTLSPWRVADPLIRLLMRVQVLPPFDKMHFSGIGEGSPWKQIIGDKSFHEWGRKYCARNWDNLMKPVLQELNTPEIPEPPHKRGWFR
jgi:hypothetical protein